MQPDVQQLGRTALGFIQQCFERTRQVVTKIFRADESIRVMKLHIVGVQRIRHHQQKLAARQAVPIRQVIVQRAILTISPMACLSDELRPK